MRTANFAAALAVAIAIACGDHRENRAQPDAVEDAGPPADVDAATDAAIEIAPYPPGPYRGGVGDIMPNFTIRGYALSRTQRDSTRLPFREISLAEVRSDPSCTCLAIVHTTCGTQCGPCVTHDRNLSALRVKDPSMCVMEVLQFNYDGNSATISKNQPQPPTRADVDAFTQSGRENYPVGIPTVSADRALSSRTSIAIPTTFVLDPRTMRILAHLEGAGPAENLRKSCDDPRIRVSDLATGLSPRKIALDELYAYATDWNAGVLRVRRSDNTTSPISKPDGTPDVIRLDATDIYYSVSNGSTSWIERVAKTGGTVTTLATSTEPIVDVTLDDAAVFFTSGDRVATVSKAGGDVTTVIGGEVQPSAVRVDEANVYFIVGGSHDVIRAPKIGGSREVFLAGNSLELGAPGSLELTSDAVIVVAEGVVERILKTGGTPTPIIGSPGIVSAGLNGTSLLIGTRDPELHVGMVLSGDAVKKNVHVTTPGQPNVGSLASYGADIVWTINDDDETLNQGAIRIYRGVAPP
jgi:hypothetical protein